MSGLYEPAGAVPGGMSWLATWPNLLLMLISASVRLIESATANLNLTSANGWNFRTVPVASVTFVRKLYQSVTNDGYGPFNVKPGTTDTNFPFVSHWSLSATV